MRRARVLMAMVLLALPHLVWGQAPGTGAVRGAVVDADNLPVRSASIVISEISRLVSRTVTTDARGEFSIALLAPGDYALTASADGFGTARLGEVDVTAGEVKSVT